MKTAEESIAEIRAIGKKVNDMRNNAPADDPMQGIAFRIAALCGRVEGQIHANMLAAQREGIPVEEYVRRQNQ